MEAIIIIFFVVAYLMIGIGFVARRSWPAYAILTWPLPIIREQAGKLWQRIRRKEGK